MIGHFEPFDLKVVLVVAIAGIAQFVRSLHIGPNFFEVALVQIISLTRHPLFQFFPSSDCASLNQMKFHLIFPQRFTTIFSLGRGFCSNQPRNSVLAGISFLTFKTPDS